MALLSNRAKAQLSRDLVRELYETAPKEHFSILVMTRSGKIVGARMPLDTVPHWSWRNPLNVIPATLLLLLLVALVGSIF